MDEKITITLDKSDWLEIALFLSYKIGETVNPVPMMNLLQALSITEKGIIKELDERKKRRGGI